MVFVVEEEYDEAENFKKFAKRIVAVPKKEIDEKLKQEKKKREKRKLKRIG